MRTLKDRSTVTMVSTGILTFYFGGCMMTGMMGHDTMREGTQANVATTKVIKESADHNLTLSAEFSPAKVSAPVRFVVRLTETSNGSPVRGARLRFYSAFADSGNQIYACPMHPEVVADKPGTCSICGMELKRQQRPEKPANLTTVSQENDSLTMEETGTTGEYSSVLTYSLEGSYAVSVSLMGIGDRILDPPIVLTSTQKILADHGSHTNGMGMNTTTMIVLGAVAMALMMIFSWSRWF